MARILITGMSGAGKTTLLDELSSRGHHTVDTDYDGWELPGSVWDEPRMSELLARHDDVVVSGTVETDVEPLLRQSATLELDGQQPVSTLADAIEALRSTR